MKEVSYFNYGNYSSDNYGVNTLCFTNDSGKFWFSYETLVAFSVNNEFHIIRNYWGNTTGKHLNFINSNKSIREDKETFEANYKRLVND